MKSEAAAAAAAYPSALADVIDRGAPIGSLTALEAALRAGGTDPMQFRTSVLHERMETALADEILTQDEESELLRIGGVLFPDPSSFTAAVQPYRPRIYLATVNSGRLPVVDAPMGLILKRGELLHHSEPATLLKEVVHREYRGGSRGVSFRVMKGVYYRTGSMRGQMVEVGRTLEPADDGTLHVTSQRVVYSGARKTIEVAYSKLLDLSVYTDGIQFAVSNRQTPSTFRVASGPMIAALVNAAVQKQL